MKSLRWTLFTLFLLSLPHQVAAQPKQSDDLFQFSTINALLSGLYDGNMRFDQLSRHGNFGLGTFNALNGEMLALDGQFFQVLHNGTVHRVTDDMATPFAVVTFHDNDWSMPLPERVSYSDFKTLLSDKVKNSNHFQSIRVEATFQSIKVRSVPRQEKPYRSLAQVIEEQNIFTYENIQGTLIGFRTPPYVAGLNVPGYHFHFISSDRTKGGHLLGFEGATGHFGVDEIAAFKMTLPQGIPFGPAFGASDLTGARQKQLDKVEKHKQSYK